MTSSNVKLSVIIPAYNSSETIIKTLDSIKNSISSKFEIIIVDDCSRDNTVDVVNNYIQKHDNVKIFSLSVNSGPGIARDEGLKYASGEYTLFFDSDDLMRENSADKTIFYLDKEKIDVAVLQYSIRFGRDKKDIGMWERDIQIYMEAQKKFGLILEPEKFPRFLTVTNYPWTKICKTQFLRDNNIEFGNLRLHEDILPHWMILMNASRVYLSPEIICDYVLDLDGNNVTNNKSVLRLQCIDALNVLYTQLCSQPKFKVYLAEFWSFSAGLLDWAKSVIEPDYKQVLLDSAQRIFLNISFEQLQTIFHSDRSTHSAIYGFIVNKKGF